MTMVRYREEFPVIAVNKAYPKPFISGTEFATDYQRLSGKALKAMNYSSGRRAGRRGAALSRMSCGWRKHYLMS